MNDFLIFKRENRKKRKRDIKKTVPKISLLKDRGFKSGGWFELSYGGGFMRHWKKIGEHCYLEFRYFDKAGVMEIPEVCLSIR